MVKIIVPFLKLKFQDFLANLKFKKNIIEIFKTIMANNNNDNAMDGIGENEEEDNQNGEGTKFTEEQLARKIKCRTKEGEIVEVFWHLLMQSKTFMNIWETMGGEEAFNDEMDEVDKDVFIFPVNEISTDCFGKIVEWLDEHKGQPEPVVEEDPATRERKWFNLTDWERNFLEVVDIETLAKYLAAANLLDLKSLYLYGCQEFARRLANKNPAQIREMLGIEDDLTEEEKEAIRARNLWCTY